jgi:hypothetical protein
MNKFDKRNDECATVNCVVGNQQYADVARLAYTSSVLIQFLLLPLKSCDYDYEQCGIIMRTRPR